jgi:lipopolysaccharide export system permease protein
VEIHKKYAIPSACLVFALIGLPLGIRAPRGGRWAAFVLLLPIVLFYYVFLTVGEQFGDAGRIPPWLAMWTPNIVTAGLGLYLLWGSVKERPLPFAAQLQAALWRLGLRATRLWRRRLVRSGRRGSATAGGRRPIRRSPST